MLTVGTAFYLYEHLYASKFVSTDNAYTAAETAQVTPAVGCIVSEVRVAGDDTGEPLLAGVEDGMIADYFQDAAPLFRLLFEPLCELLVHLLRNVVAQPGHLTQDNGIERRVETVAVQHKVRQAADLTLNAATLTSYLRQVQKACETVNLPPACQAQVYAGVLALPGVAPEGAYFGSPPDEEWPVVEQTLEAALKSLDAMRREEGRAMAAELLTQQRHIGAQLDAIRQQLPGVMAEYRQRLIDRIRQALKDTAVTVEPEHLVREVALFADRSDVSEEVTRLSSHLDQFAEVVRKGDEGAGRKLEFVIQEMGRETNTLGSKAGDVTVSRHVVSAVTKSGVRAGHRQHRRPTSARPPVLA